MISVAFKALLWAFIIIIIFSVKKYPTRVLELSMNSLLQSASRTENYDDIAIVLGQMVIPRQVVEESAAVVEDSSNSVEEGSAGENWSNSFSHLFYYYY